MDPDSEGEEEGGRELKSVMYSTLQEVLHDDSAGEAQGNVVTKFVVVVESMDPDGRKWLSRIDGTAGGDRLTEWDRQGLLYNGLQKDGWE